MVDYVFPNGSNHQIPDGYTKPAGRITDGAFLGRFSNPVALPGADQYTTGNKGYGTIDVYARVYRGFNKIVPTVKQYGPSTGGVTNTPNLMKSKEFLLNWVGGLSDQFKTLTSIAEQSVTQADLSTLGLVENQIFPLPPTNLAINWQVDDNGFLKVYQEPTDPNKPLQDLAAQNQKLLDNFATMLGAKGNPETDPGTTGGLAQYLRIGAWILGIAAVVAVVIVIFRAVRG